MEPHRRCTGAVDPATFCARAPQPGEHFVERDIVAVLVALLLQPVDEILRLLVVAVAEGAEWHEVPRVVE